MNIKMIKVGLLSAIAATYAGFSTSAIADDNDAYLASLVINKSGINAAAALELVEKNHKGIVYEYELEDHNDRFYHEIKLVNLEEGRKYRFKVDIETGEIEGKSDSYFHNALKKDGDVADAKKIRESGYSLRQALMTLELDKGAVVTEVEYEQKSGIHFFEIETMGPQGERKFLVDIDSQELMPGFKREH